MIYLRPITYSDTSDAVRWRNSEAVRNNFIWQGTLTEEGHTGWLNHKVMQGTVVQFVIVESETEKAIGSVYLRDVDYKDKTAEYGIFIGEEDAKGKGYGKEAGKLMLQYAFDILKLNRIILRVIDGNIPAIKSYISMGFKETDQRDTVNINGIDKTVIFMENNRQEKIK